MKNFTVCGVNISAINLDLACGAVEDWIKNRRKAYVCVVPVSTVVECQANKDYLKIVNGADMATPDGMPLVWIGRFKGERAVDRTYGPDLMLAVCKMSQEKGFSHYFYGGTAESCRLLEMRLKKLFPRLSIVGKFSPPFRNLTKEEDDSLAENINRINPDILWIGLGSPKQDFWMYEHRQKLNAPVMIAVGAAFDFVSGYKRQAPRWMQRWGLEWLFRLFSEPRRLWRRYLIGNAKFIYFLLRDGIQSLKHLKI